MRSMGLDLGSRTLGVAMSDSLGWLASAVVTLRFADNDYLSALEQVMPLIEKQELEAIVLGLPKHMNGDIGIKGEISIKFKEMLAERTKVPVILWDERLTTVAANRALISQDVSRKKRKQVVDQVAAIGILQSYLDSKK